LKKSTIVTTFHTCYHPDLSKDPNAQEKFIAINEAYNFLSKIGPTPHNETRNYNYNPEVSEYDQWRQQAKAKARAREEIRLQQQMIKQMLRSFQYAAFIILSFNVLLTVDWLLPKVEKEQRILKTSTQREKLRGGYTGYIYKNFVFENSQMKIVWSNQVKLELLDRGLVESTIIFSIPISVILEDKQKKVRIEQAYSIYHIVGYVIPIIFAIALVYITLMKTLDQKLTLAIFMIALFLFQLFLFYFF